MVRKVLHKWAYESSEELTTKELCTMVKQEIALSGARPYDLDTKVTKIFHSIATLNGNHPDSFDPQIGPIIKGKVQSTPKDWGRPLNHKT